MGGTMFYDSQKDPAGAVVVNRKEGIVVHRLSDGTEQHWRIIEMTGADPFTGLGAGALGSNCPLPMLEPEEPAKPDVAAASAAVPEAPEAIRQKNRGLLVSQVVERVPSVSSSRHSASSDE